MTSGSGERRRIEERALLGEGVGPEQEPCREAAIAEVAVPGTCGELVQGWLDGVALHVSCPIDRFAVARVAVGPEDTASGAGRKRCRRPRLLAPPDAPKAARGLDLTLAALGATGRPVSLQLASPLPRGLGMGSSTADVAGAIAAASLALGRPLPPAEIARLAVAVEPTDGSIFPGLALFDHREGRLHEPLGPPPPLALLVLEFPGAIDTVAFNRVDRRGAWRANAAAYRDALGMVRAGLAAGDLSLVGAAATLSAVTNQAPLPKPALDAVRRLAREVGALGVVAAHSGSLLGLLLDPHRHDLAAARAHVARRLPRAIPVRLHRVIEGGARPLPRAAWRMKRPNARPLPGCPSGPALDETALEAVRRDALYPAAGPSVVASSLFDFKKPVAWGR